MLGPDTFSVESNTFTFYFDSDNSYANGHVVFDWECVDHCIDQVHSLGGNFRQPSYGLYGELHLTQYPHHTDCKHVVRTDRSCVEIEVKEGVQDL